MRGPARGPHRGTANELGALVRQGSFDLVFDVGRISPVVTTELPKGQQVGASLHVLGQAGRARAVKYALASEWIGRPREHEDAVAYRPDGALEVPERGNLRLKN